MKKIVLVLIILVFTFLLFYINLPVIQYGFTSLPIILLVVTILALVLFSSAALDRNKNMVLTKKPHKIFFVFLGLLLGYLIVLPIITSSALVRTKEFQTKIGEVKNGKKISKHIAPISIDEIRVVDENLAYLLGEKIIGSQPALGSQVELG
jgi:hypothetical protein